MYVLENGYRPSPKQVRQFRQCASFASAPVSQERQFRECASLPERQFRQHASFARAPACQFRQFCQSASFTICSRMECASQIQLNLIPEQTAQSAVPGVSPGRGLLILHYRLPSSKSLSMGDGDKIFYGMS